MHHLNPEILVLNSRLVPRDIVCQEALEGDLEGGEQTVLQEFDLYTLEVYVDFQVLFELLG